MLINVTSPRIGGRDSAVWDLCDYLNHKYQKIPLDQRFSRLDSADLAVIISEIEKCRDSYRYCAKNYLWISDKNGNDKLLTLWPGQEILLQKMEEMKARGKPQKVCLIKARQLGMSLFGSSLVFHCAAFKSNRRGMIVSEDQDQSSNLFSLYLRPMYNQLPWWMQPKYSSFTLDTGISFDLPQKEGGIGLNSSIRVQWATRKGGLGQGYRLNAFHGSEFTSWDNLRRSLEEDLKYALVNSPETIALLESTAKGAGTESHKFYNKCADLAEKAEWESIFLPSFVESKRVLAPPNGWHPEAEEIRWREVVLENWVRCDNRNCLQYYSRKVQSGNRDGKKCLSCKIGPLKPYTLTDEQIYYLVNERINASDPKIIKQELALTAEEAFIAKGEQIFSEQAIENLEYRVQRAALPKKGFFDKHGNFHGYHEDDLTKQCYLDGCAILHRDEPNHLWVWEEPRNPSNSTGSPDYYIGADVSYGKNKDFSVAWVNRKGGPSSPDVHVATFRSNTIDPITFAIELAKLGKWYHTAQIAVEYNAPGNSTADHLLSILQYDNCYRKKGQDPSNSGSYHWLTTQKSKPKIIVTMDRWLQEDIFYARDSRLLHEAKVFTKDRDSLSTGAEGGEHDDIVIAAMICLYTTHQGDYEENYGIVPNKIEQDPATCMYGMGCDRCFAEWGADDPNSIKKCRKCNCLMIWAKRNLAVKLPNYGDGANFDRDPEGFMASFDSDDKRVTDYSML